MLWRREWQSIPVFLPGKSHGWRSLLGYSPWGAKSWTRLSNFTSIFTFTFSHSIVSDSATPRTEAFQAFLSFTISQSLLKLISIVLVMPFNHLILCYSLLPLPLVFPSIRVFSNESALRIRWPKYWSFSFSISPSSEYSGLISFRIDWFDLLAVQGTLKGVGCKGLKGVGLFSNTTVQKHQSFDPQLSLWSNSHIYTWLLERT